MVDSGPFKLHVKLGEDEFSAEGPEASVRAQYKEFLQARGAQKDGRGTEPIPPAEHQVAAPRTKELERLFGVEKDGTVWLKLLPRTGNIDADALILLIYGYMALNKKSEVPVLDLAAGARKSQLAITRLDRHIMPNKRYFIYGGARRSGRYSLNNAGIAYAREVMAKMFA